MPCSNDRCHITLQARGNGMSDCIANPSSMLDAARVNHNNVPSNYGFDKTRIGLSNYGPLFGAVPRSLHMDVVGRALRCGGVILNANVTAGGNITAGPSTATTGLIATAGEVRKPMGVFVEITRTTSNSDKKPLLFSYSGFDSEDFDIVNSGGAGTVEVVSSDDVSSVFVRFQRQVGNLWKPCNLIATNAPAHFKALVDYAITISVGQVPSNATVRFVLVDGSWAAASLYGEALAENPCACDTNKKAA